MAEQAIIEYVKTQRAKGASDIEIKEALEKAGWAADQIAEGFGMPRSVTSHELLGPVELIIQSWAVLKSIWKRLLGAYLLLFGTVFVTVIIGAIIYIAFGMIAMDIALIPLLFIIVVVSMISTILFIKIVKERASRTPIMQMIHECIPYVLPNLIVGILGWLIVLTGTLLFIIPGIILSLWFIFASYEVIYENKRGFQALAQSRVYVKGRWWAIAWRIFMISLLSTLLSIVVEIISWTGSDSAKMLAGIIQLIGNIILMPLGLIYGVLLYENVRDSYTGGEVAITPKQKLLYRIALGFGIVVLVVALSVSIWAIALPSNVLEKARMQSNNVEVSTIQSALSRYYADYDIYPAQLSELNPEYIRHEIDRSFMYEQTENGATYRLCDGYTISGDKAYVGDCYSPTNIAK